MCFRWNLVLIGQAASEEMSFESVNDADADDDDGRRTNAYPISSLGAFGSGELKWAVGIKSYVW